MSDDEHHDTVMIVEDDHDVLESMAEVLEDYDYHVVRAAHGQDALDQLRGDGEKPCVILLDIMMPVMDAFQFRAEQEVDPSISRVPVVILSAHARAQEAAAQMNAAAALEKPVKLDTLLQTVAKFCPNGRSTG